MLVGMRCRIPQFEVHALAATRWWKVFAIDTHHLGRVFAIVMHYCVDAWDFHHFALLWDCRLPSPFLAKTVE